MTIPQQGPPYIGTQVHPQMLQYQQGQPVPAVPPQPAPVPPPPPRYAPDPGSRADTLLDMLETAKAQAKEAANRVTAIKKAIENEATALYAGARVIEIPGKPGRPAYRLRWVTPKGVDHDILRERHLDVYNECLAWKTPYWQLEQVKN